jgi:poly(3-hydroxybutyrate) depolymerase
VTSCREMCHCGAESVASTLQEVGRAGYTGQSSCPHTDVTTIGGYMKRIASALLVVAIAAAVVSRTYEPAPNWEYRRYNGTYQYHIYVPDGVEPGQSYPMALGLHGCCWDGDTASTIGDPISNAWHTFSYNIQPEPTYVVIPAENNYAASTLIPLCRSLFAEFPIDTQRVMLCGFSMGAAGVASLINSNPTFWSCAIYVGGASGYNSGFSNVPMFMGVGALDGMETDMIPVATSARAGNGDTRGPLQWVTGVNPYFQVYPNTGHGGGMAVADGVGLLARCRWQPLSECAVHTDFTDLG